jgi:hypothetical protein
MKEAPLPPAVASVKFSCLVEARIVLVVRLTLQRTPEFLVPAEVLANHAFESFDLTRFNYTGASQSLPFPPAPTTILFPAAPDAKAFSKRSGRRTTRSAVLSVVATILYSSQGPILSMPVMFHIRPNKLCISGALAAPLYAARSSAFCSNSARVKVLPGSPLGASHLPCNVRPSVVVAVTLPIQRAG